MIRSSQYSAGPTTAKIGHTALQTRIAASQLAEKVPGDQTRPSSMSGMGCFAAMMPKVRPKYKLSDANFSPQPIDTADPTSQLSPVPDLDSRRSSNPLDTSKHRCDWHMPTDRNPFIFFNLTFTLVIKKSKFQELNPQACFCDLVSHEAAKFIHPANIMGCPDSEATLRRELQKFFSEETVVSCLNDVSTQGEGSRKRFVQNRPYKIWISEYVERMVKPYGVGPVDQIWTNITRENFTPGREHLRNLEIRSVEQSLSRAKSRKFVEALFESTGGQQQNTGNQQQGSEQQQQAPEEQQQASEQQQRISEERHNEPVQLEQQYGEEQQGLEGQYHGADDSQHKSEESRQGHDALHPGSSKPQRRSEEPLHALQVDTVQQKLPTEEQHSAMAGFITEQQQSTTAEDNLRMRQEWVDIQRREDERRAQKDTAQRRDQKVAYNRYRGLGESSRQSKRDRVRNHIHQFGSWIADVTRPQELNIGVDGTHPAMSRDTFNPYAFGRGRPLPRHDDDTVINMADRGVPEVIKNEGDVQNNRGTQTNSSTLASDYTQTSNRNTSKSTTGTLSSHIRRVFTARSRPGSNATTENGTGSQTNNKAQLNDGTRSPCPSFSSSSLRGRPGSNATTPTNIHSQADDHGRSSSRAPLRDHMQPSGSMRSGRLNAMVRRARGSKDPRDLNRF